MSERGDVSVKLLGILTVIVILVLYIVLATGQVSAGVMAVDVGVREAARILAEDPDRTADANYAVTLIVKDFGVNATPEVAPTRENCQDRKGAVDVRVSMQVPLSSMLARLDGLDVGVSSSVRVPVREVVVRE